VLRSSDLAKLTMNSIAENIDFYSNTFNETDKLEEYRTMQENEIGII